MDLALTSNSTIVVGDLKGIRSSAKGKGRKFNRIVSNMSYLELTQMLEHKANWEGIRVIKVNERGTSHPAPNVVVKVQDQSREFSIVLFVD